MADTEATYPGLGATVDRGGQDWLYPRRIEAEAEAAYSAPGGYGSTDWLRGNQFGFSVPSGATIDGIKLEVSRYASAADKIVDTDLYLLDADGSPVGDDKAAAGYWPTSQTTKTYGGASDTWNASPTPAMVNDADFGVRLYATNYDEGTSRTAYVYWFKITVYYTEGGVSGKKASFFAMLD